MNDMPPGPRLTREELQRRMEAQFTRVIRIGTMVFGERAEPPPDRLAAVPRAAAPSTAEPPPPPAFIKHLPEHLDLDEARRRLPFTLRLPDWVPDGFVRVDEVSVTGLGMGRAEHDDGRPIELSALPALTSAHLAWRHADGRGFNYAVTQRPEWLDEDGRWIMTGITAVPPGSVREVRVQGQPAALATRFFYTTYPSQETGIRDDAQLLWEASGLHYSLISFGWLEAGETLVAIAASIPPTD
jgi:hypothetical protein